MSNSISSPREVVVKDIEGHFMRIEYDFVVYDDGEIFLSSRAG